MDRRKGGYTLLYNAFTAIADWKSAQRLADSWDPSYLYREPDEFSDRYCPILKPIEESYHWSLDETEYAADIAISLGKKFNGNSQDEMGDRHKGQIEGTRVRRSMVETTAKDISFFKHYRELEQRNGESVMKFAPMKRAIYSLGALGEILGAANRRYLEFLPAIDDPGNGIDKLNKITRTVYEEARSDRGFSFFDGDGEAFFLTLARSEFTCGSSQN